MHTLLFLEPAIDLHSVHHLLKIVNGAPLIRPPWYYDTRIQGNGLVDIQSHMADQAQWLLEDGKDFQYGRNCEIDGARLWSTPVPLDLFRTSTGLDAFPATLADRVEGDVLRLACNGEIRYRLRGVSVRQRAEWGQREPEGGGDAWHTTIRGERATIVAARGPQTGFRPELHIAPRRPGGAFDTRLDASLAAWGREFPGLARRASRHGHEIVIPAGIQSPHEAHFAMVLDDFLDLLDANEWPEALPARIRTRYTLHAARERVRMCRACGAPADCRRRLTVAGGSDSEVCLESGRAEPRFRRRLKTEMLDDLPPCTGIVSHDEMCSAAAALCEALRRLALDRNSHRGLDLAVGSHPWIMSARSLPQSRAILRSHALLQHHRPGRCRGSLPRPAAGARELARVAPPRS